MPNYLYSNRFGLPVNRRTPYLVDDQFNKYGAPDVIDDQFNRYGSDDKAIALGDDSDGGDNPTTHSSRFAPPSMVRNDNPNTRDDTTTNNSPFAKLYADAIAANSANTNTLRDTLKAGPPEEQPISKGRRVASILAAGLTGFGKDDAKSGYDLGYKMLHSKHDKEEQDYDKKVNRLTALAGLDQTQLNSQLKALEVGNENYWKGQDLDIKKAGEARADKITTANIDNLAADNERQNWDEWTDPTTGIAYRKNKSTGETKSIGKKGLTPDELAAEEGKKAKAKFENEDKPLETLRGTNDVATAHARGDEAVKLQNSKNAAAAERLTKQLQGRYNSLKPGDQKIQLHLNVINALAQDNSLADPNVIATDAAGDPYVQPDHWYDSDEVIARKAKIRKVIEDSTKKPQDPNQVNKVDNPNSPPASVDKSKSQGPPAGFTLSTGRGRGGQ